MSADAATVSFRNFQSQYTAAVDHGRLSPEEIYKAGYEAGELAARIRASKESTDRAANLAATTETETHMGKMKDLHAVRDRPRPEAPFDHLPSGIEIARYFTEHTERRNRGYDGIDLYREGNDYCYLWVETFVDMDYWHAYLLDVRTHIGVAPGKIGETRDYLAVVTGPVGAFEVEWHNQPHAFGAPGAADRFRAGMAWLVGRIEEATDR
jgi:hypothetical protein